MPAIHILNLGGVAVDTTCPPCVESLENRQFLSVSLVSSSILPTPIPVSGPSQGELIHAQANQPFTAVVGVINTLTASTVIPVGFSYQGSIDWGDGTDWSPATFVAQPLGKMDVLGSHTYTFAGSDAIQVTVLREPPPGTTGPVVLVSTIHSVASVINPDGGVTLSERAGIPFTAGLGLFSTLLSSDSLTATISWGDGSVSTGKIVAVPNANPVAGGEFEVFGDHAYASTGSYLVHVTVTAVAPAADAVNPTSILIVVAQFDSVIDALPLEPVVSPLLG